MRVYTHGVEGADLIFLTVAPAPGAYGVRFTIVLIGSLPARHPFQPLRRPPRRAPPTFPAAASVMSNGDREAAKSAKTAAKE